MLSLDGVKSNKKQFDINIQDYHKNLDPQRKSSVMETNTDLHFESLVEGGKVKSGQFQKTQNSNWQAKDNLKLGKLENQSFI